MRLLLDANVLFTAAHNPGGRSVALFALARQGACVLLTSPHAIEEARRNLGLKYPDALRALDDLLRAARITAEPAGSDIAWALAQGLPAEDAPILAAAAHADANILVTGDRTHFGAMYGRTLRGVEILSPAVALARVLE